jgi:O-antigen/teichoic acid export membrane protein
VRRSLRYNIVANVLGGGVNMVGQLVALPLALIIAGPQAYGVWVALFAIVQLSALFDLGLAPALIRRVAELSARENEEERLRAVTATSFLTNGALSLAAGTITALAALAISVGASEGAVSGSDSAALAGIAVAAAVLGVIFRQFEAVIRGIQRFDVERLHQTIAILGRIAALGVLLVADGGIVAVALVEAFTFLLSPLLSGIRMRRFAPFFSWSPRRYDRREARALLRFGVSWFSLASATQLAAFLPTFLAALLAGPSSATAVGAGLRVAQALRQTMAWLLDPLLPNLMTLDGGRRERLTVRGTLALAILGAAVIVPLILEAPALMQLWLGERAPWAQAASYFQAFGLAALLTVVHLTVAVVVQAQNRPAYFAVATWVSASGTLALLAAAFLVAPELGPASIVAVAIVSEALFLIRVVTAIPGPVFRLVLKEVAVAALAALVAIGVWALARPLLQVAPLVDVALAGVIYVAAFAGAYLGLRRLTGGPGPAAALSSS